MENREHCSSTPSTEPPNAFIPEFLRALQTREDPPLAALEAELRGPWKVVELPPAAAGAVAGEPDRERWAVLRSWEDPSTDRASGTFRAQTSLASQMPSQRTPAELGYRLVTSAKQAFLEVCREGCTTCKEDGCGSALPVLQVEIVHA